MISEGVREVGKGKCRGGERGGRGLARKEKEGVKRGGRDYSRQGWLTGRADSDLVRSCVTPVRHTT